MNNKKFCKGGYTILHIEENDYSIYKKGFIRKVYKGFEETLQEAVCRIDELIAEENAKMKFKQKWITEDEYLMEQL